MQKIPEGKFHKLFPADANEKLWNGKRVFCVENWKLDERFVCVAVSHRRPQATKGSLRKMLTGSVQLILIEISYTRAKGVPVKKEYKLDDNLWHISGQISGNCFSDLLLYFEKSSLYVSSRRRANSRIFWAELTRNLKNEQFSCVHGCKHTHTHWTLTQ